MNKLIENETRPSASGAAERSGAAMGANASAKSDDGEAPGVEGETPEQVLAALCRAMAELRDADEARRFLIDLCTPGEIRAIAERWHVARLLDEGRLSYRQINEATGVSTATIGRVARFLSHEPHQGYRMMLDRLSGRVQSASNNKTA